MSGARRLMTLAFPRYAASVRWQGLLHERGQPPPPAWRLRWARWRPAAAWQRATTGRRTPVAMAGIVGLTIGLMADGPMAGLVLAGYAAVAVWGRGRRRISLAEARSRRVAVDAVSALAAELRAGLPVGVALAAAADSLEGPTVVGAPAATVARRVAQSIALAEASGAPLADVLDRLDAHLRGVDRARASASAQAAGTYASAVLLAAMPAAGVGVGHLVGADSLRILLHTAVGGACLVGAAILQSVGVLWSWRLGRIEVPT